MHVFLLGCTKPSLPCKFKRRWGIDTQNYVVLLSNFTYVTIPKAMRLWYDDS